MLAALLLTNFMCLLRPIKSLANAAATDSPTLYGRARTSSRWQQGPHGFTTGKPMGRTKPRNILISRYGPLAQRLVQRTHNPLVDGSNPSGPTNWSKHLRVNWSSSKLN